jgi:hypothetical protein
MNPNIRECFLPRNPNAAQPKPKNFDKIMVDKIIDQELSSAEIDGSICGEN